MPSDCYFQRVSTDYSKYSRWSDSRELVQTELEFLREFSGRSLWVADAGAGTCRYLDLIYTRKIYKFGRLVALDKSANMLFQNPSLNSNIKRILGDLHCMPFQDKAFDRVIGRQVLHYVDPANSLREIRRILRPGGIFHSTQQVDYSDVPDHWYTEWSALRGVQERRRLSDSRLTQAATQAHFQEVRRRDIHLRLKYTWTELAFKYGKEDNVDIVKDFFVNTETAILRRFDFVITPEGISYTSVFRVSAFELVGNLNV